MILKLKLLVNELVTRALFITALPIVLVLAWAGALLISIFILTSLIYPGYSLNKFVRGLL